MRLLVIEDQSALSESLEITLKATYIVDVARSGKVGLHLATTNHYDLILLDLNLADIHGIRICQDIRSAKTYCPIIMLTTRYGSEEMILALDSGADHYVAWPLHLDELKAQVRSLIRRGPSPYSATILTASDLVVDTGQRRVTRAGEPIPLRRKEFDILEYLIRCHGRVVTREMILEQLWSDADVFTNVVDVHIKHLRDKIDYAFDYPLIKTVHGIGYKIETT